MQLERPDYYKIDLSGVENSNSQLVFVNRDTAMKEMMSIYTSNIKKRSGDFNQDMVIIMQ